MCSSMKQPKPDRLVEMDGIPMTVHSAGGETTMKNIVDVGLFLRWIFFVFLTIESPHRGA